MELRPWLTVSKRTLLDRSPYLVVESHRVQLPDGQVIDDWSRVILPDSAVVIAETADLHYLCFRQTKYAIEGSSLAPIGGVLEVGERPIEGAKRELLEETGYVAEHWESLGSYVLDGSRGVRTANLFLARAARKVAEPAMDDLEDQELLLLTRTELASSLDRGEFKVMSWAGIVALVLRRISATGHASSRSAG